MLLPQGLADTANLVTTALTGIFHRIDLHRMLRYHRTVLPDQFQRVEVRTEREAILLTKVSNQLLHIIHRTASAVDGHLAPVLIRMATLHNLLTQPLGNRWRTLDLQFHQLILRSLQLFLSRKEIARVRPKGCRRQRHHRRTRRTVKAADPLPTLPMVGHIFTLMGVGTGEDAGRKMLTPHHLPKVFQSFINRFCHILLVFHTAIRGIDGIGHAVRSTTTESENHAPFSIVLRDKAGVIACLTAPAPAHCEAVTTEKLHSSAGLSEVISTRVEHITTTRDFARLRIDIETEYTCELRVVAVAVVKEGERIVIVESGIVLAVEAQTISQCLAVDTPEDVARLMVDLQQ